MKRVDLILTISLAISGLGCLSTIAAAILVINHGGQFL